MTKKKPPSMDFVPEDIPEVQAKRTLVIHTQDMEERSRGGHDPQGFDYRSATFGAPARPYPSEASLAGLWTEPTTFPALQSRTTGFRISSLSDAYDGDLTPDYNTLAPQFGYNESSSHHASPLETGIFSSEHENVIDAPVNACHTAFGNVDPCLALLHELFPEEMLATGPHRDQQDLPSGISSLASTFSYSSQRDQLDKPNSAPQTFVTWSRPGAYEEDHTKEYHQDTTMLSALAQHGNVQSTLSSGMDSTSYFGSESRPRSLYSNPCKY